VSERETRRYNNSNTIFPADRDESFRTAFHAVKVTPNLAIQLHPAQTTTKSYLFWCGTGPYFFVAFQKWYRCRPGVEISLEGSIFIIECR